MFVSVDIYQNIAPVTLSKSVKKSHANAALRVHQYGTFKHLSPNMIIRRPVQHWGLAMECCFSSFCRFTVQTVRLLLPCFNSSSVRLSTWKPIARRRKDVRDEDEDGRVRGWERVEAAMLTPRFQPERSDLTAVGKPHGCHNFSVTSARGSEGGEVWVMLQSVLAPSGSGTDISSMQRGSRGWAGGRAKTGSRLQALLEEN